MGTPELEKFIIDMTQELNNKDGLILDLRYNTGGNVHDEVLKFLQQRSYLKWKYREGKLTQQGNFTPSDKPIVLLINEQSLSDAEMTAQGFKALKLGKIIGNETYRWIIFTVELRWLMVRVFVCQVGDATHWMGTTLNQEALHPILK